MLHKSPNQTDILTKDLTVIDEYPLFTGIHASKENELTPKEKFMSKRYQVCGQFLAKQTFTMVHSYFLCMHA